MKPVTPLNIFLNETTGNAGIAPAPSVLAKPSLVPSTGSEIIPHVETIDLTNAETVGYAVNIPNNVFSVPWATDSTVVVGLVYHELGRHEAIKVGKNYFWGGVPCQRVYLTWAAQAGKSIQISTWQDPNPVQRIRAE